MKVKFVPQNVEFEIRPGESVMHVAQDHGLYIKSVCKGVPSCAECRVRVVDGEHNVMQPGSEELSLIGTGHFIDHRRLSCQLKCFGDITIDMTEQIAKQQGLMGGQKKKKLSIKDDRIEDAAIRSSSASSDSGDEADESAEEGAAPEEELEHDEHDEGDEEEIEAAPAAENKSGGPRAHAGGEPRPGGGEPGAQRSGRRRRRRGGRGGRGGGGGRHGGGQPGREPGRK